MQEIDSALTSPDEETRLQGLRQLAGVDAEQSLALIFRGLGDESWRVRKEAIALFLRLPISRERVGEVVNFLYAEENAGLRNAAVEVLTRLGREAVPELIAHAHSCDHDVRKFIVDILGDIGDESAVPVLIAALADDDGNVRAAAAENLGKLRAAAGVPALLDAMEHPDLLLQFTILDSLSRIGAAVPYSRLMPFKGEKLLRKALVDCLGNVGDAAAVDELVGSLRDPMRNVREAAVLAVDHFARRFPEEVRGVVRKIETGPVARAVAEHLEEGAGVELKIAAIRTLGWLGAAESTLRLLSMLDHEALQRDGVAALIEIARVHPEVTIDLWEEVDNRHRSSLAYIFAEAGCQQALPYLRQALFSVEPQLQRMSAYALGKLNSPEVLPDLVISLQDGAGDVQESSAQALIDLGASFPQQTLEAVLPVLQSDDPVRRRFAVSVLGRLQGDSIGEALCLAIKDPDAEVRRSAVKAFESREIDDFLGTILLALTDEDAEVRCSAVEILGGQQGEEVFAGLELALRDEDLWVRCQAVRGLGRQGGGRARQLIEVATADPVGLVSIAALETLVELAGPAACPKLLAALNHNDEEVITAVLNLLSVCDQERWLPDHLQTLIDHPHWGVRAHSARLAAQSLGADARELLHGRLLVEKDPLVCQQLEDLLADLEG